MLLLASVLALAVLPAALARWQHRGNYFQPLFQFLLMGLNGAFLTGDLFNLFVFFEVLLAASYGLALHGSGARRVSAGLHYIAVNLTASIRSRPSIRRTKTRAISTSTKTTRWTRNWSQAGFARHQTCPAGSPEKTKDA